MQIFRGIPFFCILLIFMQKFSFIVLFYNFIVRISFDLLILPIVFFIIWLYNYTTLKGNKQALIILLTGGDIL